MNIKESSWLVRLTSEFFSQTVKSLIKAFRDMKNSKRWAPEDEDNGLCLQTAAEEEILFWCKWLLIWQELHIKKEGGKWQPSHVPLHLLPLCLIHGFYAVFRCPRLKLEAQASLQKTALSCASFHMKISRCPCSYAQICLRPNTCLLLELHHPSSERSDLAGGSEFSRATDRNTSHPAVVVSLNWRKSISLLLASSGS